MATDARLYNDLSPTRKSVSVHTACEFWWDTAHW